MPTLTHRLLPLLACLSLLLPSHQAHAIVAGDLNPPEVNGVPLYPPDDPNTPYDPIAMSGRLDTLGLNSPFSGVGTIYGGTGPLIDSTHVLTAAHLFGPNFSQSAGVTFNLDTGQGFIAFQANRVDVHPQYQGVGNDDLYDIAVVTLDTPVPDTFHTYGPFTAPLAQGTTLTLVGYGQTGDGVHGYSGTSSNPNIYPGGRRVGQNTVGGYLQPGGAVDTGPYQPGDQTYLFDFDSPVGSSSPAPDYLIGPSLGNDKETTIGVGDSGGPAFVFVDGQYQVAAINNFRISFQYEDNRDIGYFGSGGGGAIISGYQDFLADALAPAPEPDALSTFGVGAFFVLAAVRRARKSHS